MLPQTLTLPPVFLERLEKIIPSENFQDVVQSFSCERPVTVRINTLKTDREQIFQLLKERKISFKEVPWSEDALILDDVASKDFGEIDVVKDGLLYRQALSSMLPVLVLDPHPGERVLDLCAAPGSKTTQIASAMKNQGELVAVEAIKPRFYRLKSVCAWLGATNISFKLTDGRRYRSEQQFDKILLDSPCSSEGRFRMSDPKSIGYWSPRKIKEMVRKQRGLLLTASRLLKPGGVLVYSTCTFAPEENEGVVSWLLKKMTGNVKVEPVSLSEINTFPALTQWEGKAFSDQVKNCFRILPDGLNEGFFIAKLVKG